MSAKGRRATGLDGAQGAVLHGGQRLCAAQVAPVKADDVREFRPLPSLCHRPVRERTGHGSVAHRLREFQQVQWRAAVRDLLPGEMEVAHRRADVMVPEQTLNRVEVCARF